jgi:hypothetical protein
LRDESVAEQRLDPDLRPAFAEDADLQVHVAFTQGANLLVGLGREPKPHARRLGPQAGEESGSHRFDEAVVGADRERPLDRGGIENVVAGLKDRKGLLGDLADLNTQRFGPGRQHQPTTGADQERVRGRGAQSVEGAAHRRWTETHLAGGADDADFGQQGVKRRKKAEIGNGHGKAPAAAPMN